MPDPIWERPSCSLCGGIVVVPVEQAVAAPTCTRHLGDLGAQVIKGGEPTRRRLRAGYDDVVHGQGAYFTWANRNKESVALDPKRVVGREVLVRLATRADVLVQKLAPGAADRLGLAAGQLRAVRPELITVGISGYGRVGPAKPGIPLADIGAAMYAAASMLAALFVRERTGEGTAISVGLFDVVAEWMGFALNQARYAGCDVQPNGLSSPAVAPYGGYETADGQTLVLGTTNDHEWQRRAAEDLAAMRAAGAIGPADPGS